MTRRAMRGVLIFLALPLNGWPLLEPRPPAPHFLVPARAESAPEAPVFKEEIINPDSPRAMSHVASIAELFGGGLAATWYAGSREGAHDVGIYFSTQASE